MGELEDRLAKLSPERRALLERMLAEKRAASTGPIPAAPEGSGPFPLSFAQERFWFLEQLEPGNLAHHIAGVTRLGGTLDVEAFIAALDEVIRRHEILRTTFDERDGRPVQIVEPATPIPLVPQDLRGLSGDALARERARWEAEILRRPFDLRRGPLMRWALLRLGDEEWELLSCLHHIIADGLSARVLAAEHGAFYTARLRGEPVSLSPLPIQYRDYAAWQRRTLTEAMLDERLEYWREQLADVTTLALPIDRPRHADGQSQGARVRRRLSEEVFTDALSLAREEQITPFVMLLATFEVALSRWTGQTDIAVGTPAANRDRAEVEGLVGFFVNSLVLRLETSDDPSFRDLLHRARKIVLDAQEHQDVPFERIVDALQPERHLDRNPLFQVVFNYVDYVGDTFELPGLTLQYHSRPAGTLFDVTLYATRHDNRLELEFEYDADLFEAEKMERFLAELEVLLAGAVADPDRPLSALPIHTSAESERLTQWENGAPIADGAPVPAHEWVGLQAQRTPDAIAIEDGQRRWTYAQLDAAATQLAKRLGAAGHGPGMRVGLMTERTGELLVALLGIGRAGAAYVPLDPDFPPARLTDMAADAQLSAIVTQPALASRCPADTEPLFVIDETIIANAPLPASDLDAAMYVIYTSGSTGRPKGVIVPHRTVTRFLEAMVEQPGLTASDVLVAVTTISFDIAVLELLGPLMVGGRVVIAPRETALDGVALGSLLESSHATVLQATPATWRMLRLAGWPGRPGLRMLCGGEPLPRDLAEELLPLGTELWNLYGPTETTIWSTVERIQSAPGRPITIGRPIRGTRTRIVDRHGHRVPIGVDGELWIGGAGVASGYWQRESLTAERFVSDADGQPWYRTGDRARWLADGRLLCLGRLDAQIKLRGFRIEPGEIETILREHPSVVDAAVTLFERSADDRRLVAYVTADPGASTAESVEQWTSLWDTVYADSTASDPTFDLSGWGDSTTGSPMPEASMRQWVDGTVERLRALHPKRLLEIGCGLGLLLFRLAPHCERYRALDASPTATERIRRLCDERGLEQVTVDTLGADDLDRLGDERFDVIVLNSVAQYFPSADYFLDVVSKALTRLTPGGHLFLGDLRSARHLKAFHTLVQIRRADPEDSVGTLRERIARQLQRERELVFDPALFEAWSSSFDVHIELRRGAIHDELSLFRYDVILTAVRPEERSEATSAWDAYGSLPSLREHLTTARAEALRVTDIPNARLTGLVAAQTALDEAGASVESLRQLLESAPGIEPDLIRDVAAASGYEVELRWAASESTECLDAVFRRPRPTSPSPITVTLPEVTPEDRLRWVREPLPASDPLPAELREHLRNRLPEALLPSHIVRLESLPRTPNGKLDRRALPAPDAAPRRAKGEAPRTEEERLIADLFSEILQVESVGRDDDFFDLGGHSLLATQIISRLRQRVGAELPLRQIFSTPRVRDLAAALAEAGAGEDRPGFTIPTVSRAGALPVSFAQERFWFLHQLDPDQRAYHMPGAALLDGPIDETTIRAAFERVARRQESLRTFFRADVEGRPRAHVRPDPSLDWISESLIERPDPLAAFRERARAIASSPFDLAAGPLVRIAWFELGPRWHGLLVVLHHIIADGWSIGVLLHELQSAVEAELSHRDARLPALGIQVIDWAAWRRDQAESGGLDDSLSYWVRQLDGAPRVLAVPTDSPRPPVVTDHGARFVARLDLPHREMLAQLARATRATPFQVLLAAFGELVRRLTGQGDFLVATPVAGRDHPDTEPLIGCFIEQVVLRLRPGEAQTFEALVEQVRDTVGEALSHADLPFERIVEALDPPRDRSRHPLVQVSFESLDLPMRLDRLGGARVTSLPLEEVAPKFELTFRIGGDANSEVTIEYRADLFEPRTIERWWHCFERLLAECLSAPGQPLHTRPMLPPTQRDELLRTAAGPSDSSMAARPIAHALFETIARRRDQTAVRHEDASWSFGELGEQAERIAAELHARGLTSRDRIALSLPRSFDLLAAWLGALRAGIPYVPIDPSDPVARRQWILKDSGARLVITDANGASSLPDGFVGDAVTTRDLVAGRGEPPPLPTAAEDPAYVLYTSGSTGRPKGVVVTQRGLANYVEWASRSYPIADGDGSPLFTSLGFDLTITSVLPTWRVGRTVHVIPEGPGIEPLRSTFGRGQPFGLVKLTPAHLDALALVTTPEQRRGWTRCLVVGGEALTEHHTSAWLEADPSLEVFNEYGPTETVVGCCVHAVARDESGAHPIGRPIANTRLYVVDDEGELAAWGAPGELWIAGAGVASGYLGRDDLTAERFVTDPFVELPGERVYRSGDRVRRRADGRLVYLGRGDDQVKIRGYRVELGEIEAVLRRQPGVRECAVTTREGLGGRRLLAAVTGEEPERDAWRAGLARELPNAWIPSAFVLVPQLPLTALGKVDRAALPDPDPTPTQAATPPRDPLEQALAAHWCAVLGRESIDVQDGFFALGGDSILALQIVARAQRDGLPLQTADLFEYATIAELAAALRERPGSGRVASGPRPPGPRELGPTQEWFFGRRLVEPHHWNQSLAFTVRADVEPGRLQAALDEILTQHEALRWRFTGSGSEVSAHAIEPEPFPLDVIDLEGALEPEARRAFDQACRHAQKQLDLAKGPLTRGVLVRLGSGAPSWLGWIVHHLVIDGVSWRILIEELSALLDADTIEGVLSGEPTTLGEWNAAIRERQRSDDVPFEPASTPLGALSLGDAPNVEGQAIDIVRRLSHEDTRALLEAAPTWRAGIDELLLTALSQALADVLGPKSWRVDGESHGRDGSSESDLSHTAGWFTRFVPMILPVPEAEVDETVASVKEAARRARTASLLRSGEAPAASAPILVNYLGRSESIEGAALQPWPEPIAEARSPLAARSHELELLAWITDGQLTLRWSYARGRLDGDLALRLAESLESRLPPLARGPSSPGSTAVPSDFPTAGLDRASLRRLLTDAPDTTDLYPLTPTQQGMFFHSRFAPEAVAYVEQLHLMLSSLDVSAWSQALEELLRRHEPLRSEVVWDELERPLWRVRSRVPLPLTVIDGREWEDEAARLEEWQRAERRRGFEWDRAPLLRWVLIDLAGGRHAILLTYHHALLDGWSMAILLREMTELYAAARSGRAALPRPAPPYGAYVAWLEDQDLEEARRFWQRELAAFDTPTPLLGHTLSRPRGASELLETELVWDEDRTQRWTERTRAAGWTASTTVQAAWALLLHRYGAPHDVVFGATVSGRPATLGDLERRVGLYINTVPVRVQVPEHDSIRRWLTDLQQRQAARAAFEWTPLPVSQAGADVPPGTPLFDSLIVFENYPLDRAALSAGTDLGFPDVLDAGSFERTSYGLTLVVVPGDRLILRLLHATDLADASRGEKLLRHLAQLLDGITAAPERSASAIPMLTDSERAWLRDAATVPTTPAASSSATVLDRFERRVVEAPDAIALIDGDRSWTYRELQERAHQLASVLRESLPEIEEPIVGVCLPRCVDTITALLAVPAAGGATLPLELSLPPQRLSTLVRESGCTHVIALPEHRPALEGVSVRWIDPSAKPSRTAPALVAPTPDRLAYVLFTSGSTGEPKGVAVEQRALAHYVAEAERAFALTPEDRVLQFASLAFDTSAEEIYPTLLAGAQLVLRDESMIESVRGFCQGVEKHRLTVLDLPTSFWHELVVGMNENDLRRLHSVRLVILGGEAATPEAVSSWREHVGERIRLLNTYGPTEGTIVTTWADLTRHERGEPVPIGRPIPGARVHVLDAAGQELPPEVPGELWIGGSGLARGYLGRPDLTARRFRDDIPGLPDTRLYRTGDRVRFRSDGALLFLGRVDDQVKMRGQRIEIGEVEAMLRRHPATTEVAVIHREAAGGQLVAFVEGEVSLDELRDFVRDRLPSVMVPGRWIPMARLPRTPSGKIDRRRLATLADEAPRSKTSQPRSELEGQVAAAMSTALGQPELSSSDDFFENGGDSLKALRLMRLLEEVMGREIPLALLFRHSRISDLAAALESETSERDLISSASPIDWGRETRLDDAIAPTAGAWRATGEVLLTGATGFLGAFVLRDWLNETADRVHCLVRASDDTAALERLREALARFGLASLLETGRVTAHAGDLSRERFGWSARAFEALAERVDRVIHVAASTSFFQPYRRLVGVNVTGTRHALAFACTGPRKRFEHVSTIGVLDAESGTEAPSRDESSALPPFDHIRGAYAQTKAVAEVLVREAGRRGLDVAVYRPGRLVADEATGAVNPEDLAARLTRLCLRICAVPAVDLAFDATPVDVVSLGLVRLALTETERERPYHLISPEPLESNKLRDWVLRERPDLEVVSLEAWRARALPVLRAESPELLPLFDQLAPQEDEEPAISCDWTWRELSARGVACPKRDREWLSKVLTRLSESTTEDRDDR